MDENPAVSRESALVGPAADLDKLCINAIRMLSIDAVQQANSGHPGMPMGAATMAYACGRAIFGMIRRTHRGPTATASFSRPDMAACCCTACCF